MVKAEVPVHLHPAIQGLVPAVGAVAVGAEVEAGLVLGACLKLLLARQQVCVLAVGSQIIFSELALCMQTLLKRKTPRAKLRSLA